MADRLEDEELSIEDRIKELEREVVDRRRAIDDLRGVAELPTATWEKIGDAPERLYGIETWLPIGCVSSLYGVGGFGKSRLALQMAAGIASGGGIEHCAREECEGPTHDHRVWIGELTSPQIGNAIPLEGAPVLFCSWEDDLHEQSRRLSLIRGGLTPWVTPERLGNLHFAHLAGDGAAWGVDPGKHTSTMGKLQPAGERIRRRARDLGTKLVVLDPLAGVFNANENDRGMVRAFLNEWNAWATEAETAVLIVAHESKSSSVSGSTDWEAGPRSLLTFSFSKTCGHGDSRKCPKPKEGQEECPKPSAKLEHAKANYSARWDALRLVEGTMGGYRWRVDGKWYRDDGDPNTGDDPDEEEDFGA